MTSASVRWHAGSRDLSGDLEVLRVPGRESEAIDAATRAEDAAADDADGQASAALALGRSRRRGRAEQAAHRVLQAVRRTHRRDLYRAIRNRLRSEDLV